MGFIIITYKNPESVLVVIHVPTESIVLMLQRKDDALFWQSVTGSLEKNETPYQAALREVQEETGINIIQNNLSLIDANKSIVFDIYPQFLHRYAPGIQQNKEHWFYLPLPAKTTIHLTEHDDYQWLSYSDAAELTKSWNNRDAILAISKISS